jgi:hypothetical protein
VRRGGLRFDPARTQARQGQLTDRVDGIVAAIMAIGRRIVTQHEPQPEYSMFLCLSRAAIPPKPEELRRRLPMCTRMDIPRWVLFWLYPNRLTCKLNVPVDLGTC